MREKAHLKIEHALSDNAAHWSNGNLRGSYPRVASSNLAWATTGVERETNATLNKEFDPVSTVKGWLRINHRYEACAREGDVLNPREYGFGPLGHNL